LEHLQPAYLRLKDAELQEKKQALYEVLKECRLCPRECKVNRLKGEIGYCRAPKGLVVSSIGPHFGEEPELVGRGGSGTIFFSHCNLRCIFCQNYEISHLGYGIAMSEEALSEKMVFLQKIGCHNINLVTPTHYIPQIVSSIEKASKFLSIPIVYNSSGYERVEILRILEGIIDIYMPDMKYGELEPALTYSNAPDYFDVAKEAIKEMHRQVGDLLVIEGQIAKRGLIVRHLVLPNNEGGTHKVIEFISSLSKNTYINIMDQYRPLYQANRFPKISRMINFDEYQNAIKDAKAFGLSRGFG